MFNIFNIYSDPWMNCQGWVNWPGPGWKREKQWRISSSGSGKEDLKFKSHNNGNGGTFSIWMNETTKSNLCWHVGGNLKNFLQQNVFCRHLILFRKQCIFPFLTLAMYSYGQHLATSTMYYNYYYQNMMQENHSVGQGNSTRAENKFQINWTKAETQGRCRKTAPHFVEMPSSI